MEDYFKPRKRKVHVDLTKDSTNEATNSKKKKEYVIKRGAREDFSTQTTTDRIKLMEKFAPKGNWRRFYSLVITYTELIQTWSYGVTRKSCEVWHFCP